MTTAGVRTAWLVAGVLLSLAFIPCAAGATRGPAAGRVVALELGGVVASLLLLVLAEATGETAALDVGVALALLCFGAGVTVARFLERLD